MDLSPHEQIASSQRAFRESPSPMRALAYIRVARHHHADAPEFGAVVDEVMKWFSTFEAGPDPFDDPEGWMRRHHEQVQEKVRDFDQRFGARPRLRRFSLRGKA